MTNREVIAQINKDFEERLQELGGQKLDDKMGVEGSHILFLTVVSLLTADVIGPEVVRTFMSSAIGGLLELEKMNPPRLDS